jgi:adenylate cyclase
VRFQNKLVDPDTVWLEWFSTDAFKVDKQMRHVFRVLPRDPRCKFCNAPFRGVGGNIVRMLFGKQRSALNPRFCNLCEEASRQFPGGAEVDMAMLFVDIRGSTALAEKMSPRDYGQLINRFYAASTKIIIAADGLVEKLAGDEVVAFWGAGFAGASFVTRAVQVAQQLSKELARQGIPTGVGVHFGKAFFGALGTADGLTDISAKGDAVNTAARLASKAGPGEIVISEQAIDRANMDGSQLESRSLELKGISQPVQVRVMQVRPN